MVKIGEPARAVRPRQARALDRHRLPQAPGRRRSGSSGSSPRSSASSRPAARARSPRRRIGEMVMDGLKALDPVAYIRFASVYKDFREAKDFEDFAGIGGRSGRGVSPPPAIVLVRPQLGENIGKAARAMLNFGLTDLRLVAPRDGWPNPVGRARPRRAPTSCSSRRGCSTASPRRSPTAPTSMPPRCASAAWSCRCVTPEEAAREIRGQCRALRHPVRRRAVGARDRGGGDRRQDRHRAGQSRLPLAQPRPGGDPGRL